MLTDSLLAGQWTLQRHAGGRQVWARAGLKHGGDVEGHPVRGEASLYEASEHIGRVVPVVGDAAQSGVDGDHHQQELNERTQKSSPSPRQPRLQVKS